MPSSPFCLFSLPRLTTSLTRSCWEFTGGCGQSRAPEDKVLLERLSSLLVGAKSKWQRTEDTPICRAGHLIAEASPKDWRGEDEKQQQREATWLRDTSRGWKSNLGYQKRGSSAIHHVTAGCEWDVKPKTLVAELTPALGVGARVPAVLPLDSVLRGRLLRCPDPKGMDVESKATPCVRILGRRG